MPLELPPLKTAKKGRRRVRFPWRPPEPAGAATVPDEGPSWAARIQSWLISVFLHGTVILLVARYMLAGAGGTFGSPTGDNRIGGGGSGEMELTLLPSTAVGGGGGDGGAEGRPGEAAPDVAQPVDPPEPADRPEPAKRPEVAKPANDPPAAKETKPANVAGKAQGVEGLVATIDGAIPSGGKTRFAGATAGMSKAPEFDSAPPVALATPGGTGQGIGPPLGPMFANGRGGGGPGGFPTDVRSPVRSNGIRGTGGAAGAGLGIGNANFFGIQDKATRVVYVLDCSGSMLGNQIATAKSELMASLGGLDRSQQFQILFYNQNVMEMSLPGDRTGLYFASEVNRTLARQFIDSVQADLGTDHMPALTKALRLTPEVLFFLTDSDSPLSAREMNAIEKLNQGRTHIHVIEFGKGPELPNIDNFLKQLARKNGGRYRYRDVLQFNRG